MNSQPGKGILFLIIITFTVVLFAATAVLIAADQPEQVIIENNGYKKDMKGAVTLSHKKHSVDYKIKCNECHHVYEGAKNNIWKETDPVKKCNECHDPEKKLDNAQKLQTSFHNNCKDCHKESGKEKAPYKVCNDCHAKK